MLILALRREILSAAVAVLQEAAARPAVSDRYAFNPFSPHFVVLSGGCPANGCTGVAPTGDRYYRYIKHV
ncbi:hypothetical protein [Escherichia albertii]|uniref:hypothetical protein n=1 Tax=Escherichia albertii TaxID=208962 RepID=UPI00211A3A53|nr:hypothetical protein [Escherichia albertii]MCQ8984763.1 hypothetical protein [Escherichia albertii]MCQ9016132.1 hypothetical protein [Escherichia albertii]UUL43905.1 hypothetical protein NIY85_04875 [Escherichia albertii]WDB58878.1 hypothetical protein PS044_05195 [Escherichia albertii]